MSESPTILWLADTPGWAYDQIVQNISVRLPGYRHEVFYMVAEHNWQEWLDLGIMLMGADVIVSMHLMYQKQIFADACPSNVVMMATGMRLFE